MKEYVDWLLDSETNPIWVALAIISAVLFSFELAVLFVTWDVSRKALRFEIIMLIIAAIPYVAYRLEKRNERS